MIKIQNNTATRETLPQFLIGLSSESLADLSWTDSQLGVQDCAWWNETNGDTPINHETHKYGNETLTIDNDSKTVTVTHEILPLSQIELDAIAKEKRQQRFNLVETLLTTFATQKEIDVSEIPLLLNSTNTIWQSEAQRFQELYLKTWQAFYDDKPLPLLEW